MGARVIIMAGGTGGHVYPALAVAQELQARGCEVTWLGTAEGLEARVVPAAGITLDSMKVVGIRGKAWYRRLAGPVLLGVACIQALGILRQRRPEVVLGMGGFVSGPGGLVARVLSIPLIIHEQNCIPGTTNRWLAKMARVVLEAFPGTFPPHIGARCTGNPLRRALSVPPTRRTRGQGDALRILVVGGSQGAKVLNEIVPAALGKLDRPYEIRHQTGASARDETEKRYRERGTHARVDAFIDDMAEAYAWADLGVCRAGAMTVSELAAAGLPAILVPYPYAIDDHQAVNARFFADAGAGIWLPQSQFTAENLAAELERFCIEPERLRNMGERALSLATLDAAERVAEVCLREAIA